MRYILATVLLMHVVFAQSIEEKELELSSERIQQLKKPLQDVNHTLHSLRKQLADSFTEVSSYIEREAEPAQYRDLLKKVSSLRREIAETEVKWKERQKEGEGFGLFDQEESTISQLVMEYGAPDYLYVIPPEIGSMKIHMHSEISIPRESWSDLIEAILSQNGVGIREVNPFTRQLVLMKQDLIAVDAIVSKKEDLPLLSENKRIVFVVNCDPERAKAVAQFFDRFRDSKMGTVYQIGSKVALISSVRDVKKLITLYQTVWNANDRRVSRVFPLTKIPAKEMEKILKAFFEDSKKRVTLTRGLSEDLTIMTLQGESTLAVVGALDMVERAEEIVRQTEDQISDPSEMAVYWYTCKHSDPIEVSAMLEKVYASLIGIRSEGSGEEPSAAKRELLKEEEKTAYPTYGTPSAPPVVTTPVTVPTTAAAQKVISTSQNFVPYPQTGAIMIVVRKDTLPQIKDLLQRLDVPKKMVQVEVLLFEKTTTNQNNFGLNLLKIGANSKHISETGLDYDHEKTGGILDFFMSRPASKHFPSFDFTYNFLMSQDDVRVNASPTILTLNQTPAQFSNVEELSINSGAAPIETNGGITFENSYVRAQYGVNIVVTPTIHETQVIDGDPRRFVTLETNVSFDTVKSNTNSRPDVNRRHVVNNVRILDGETVVLGGLQRKIAEDSSDKIPFLGELPGLGKFFGTSKMRDKITEMFMFLTPHVIDDDDAQMKQLRTELLMQRPGDIPEFLERIQQAKNAKRQKLFVNSFKLLFGSVDG